MDRFASRRAPEDLVAFCLGQQPRLRGFLTLYCGDVDVATELTQEALARACYHWTKVRRMAKPEAWLTRVAINLANSHYRRLVAERRAHQRASVRAGPSEPDEADALAIRAAIAKLPRRQRLALVLRYFGDLSVSQVADLMECPEGTVKTLTYKAIAALRQGIRDGDSEEVSHVR